MNHYASAIATAEIALQAESNPQALGEALSELVMRAPIPGPYWDQFTPDRAVLTSASQRERAARLVTALDRKIEDSLLDSEIAAAIAAAIPRPSNIIPLNTLRPRGARS